MLAAPNFFLAGKALNPAAFLLKVNSGPTFTDVGKNSFTISTSGSPAASTSVAKFSKTSLSLSSSSYLSAPDSSVWDFGTQNFTIEAWVYPTTTVGSGVIASKYTSTTSGWWLRRSTSNYEFGNGNTSLIQRSGAVSNAWAHLAVCRSGTSLRLFIDGVQSGVTVTNSTDFTTTTSLMHIGVLNGSTQYYTGYIQDLRISTTALYIADFTPPDSLT